METIDKPVAFRFIRSQPTLRRYPWMDANDMADGCPEDFASDGEVVQYAYAKPEFSLAEHLQRQRDWSEKTFGPGSRAQGVVDHIRKELLEIEADPTDLTEWIDVAILALDGAWRSGATPLEIITALVTKQARNESRVWPDWRNADPNKAIEHDRSGEVAGGALHVNAIDDGGSILYVYPPGRVKSGDKLYAYPRHTGDVSALLAEAKTKLARAAGTAETGPSKLWKHDVNSAAWDIKRAMDALADPTVERAGEVVAHCFLRKNGDGEWVNDAKRWADGAPSTELVKDAGKYPDLYRIKCAYAKPCSEGVDLTGQVVAHRFVRIDDGVPGPWNNGDSHAPAADFPSKGFRLERAYAQPRPVGVPIAVVQAYLDASRPLMYTPSFSNKAPGHTAQAEFRKAAIALTQAMVGGPIAKSSPVLVVPEERKSPPLYPDESREDQAMTESYNSGWNDCRKAMLSRLGADHG